MAPRKQTTPVILQQPVAKLGDLPGDYDALLDSISHHIREAQVRAATAVNQELVLLYWRIGREVVTRQEVEGWGTKIVERLGSDLRDEFPEMRGLSARNLNYMRAFAAAYPSESILQQAVAKIPWGHNIALIEKLDVPAERLWYAQKTIENGWSRAVLIHQIESGLYRRQGGAISNFHISIACVQVEKNPGVVTTACSPVMRVSHGGRHAFGYL